MRKTIITPSRIITYIMNLWGRYVGLAFLAFIFVSCQEDENSLLGFKSQISKFKVSYLELPVPSTAMRIDSVLTVNDINQPLSSRLMVGRYVDNLFGEITAEAYTQFGPIEPVVNIPSTATLLDGYLVLSPDFYQYGDNVSSTSTFTVYQLTDSIRPISSPLDELPKSIQGVPNYQPYYFDSSIPYDPTPIGTGIYSIDPSGFDQKFDDIRNNPSALDPKTIDTLKIQLKPPFIDELFAMARNQTADYKTLSRFRRTFKGLLIRPGATDTKVMGFNPSIDSSVFAKSRIILRYEEPDPNSSGKLTKTLEYSLFNTGLLGFTKISADRGSTPLSTLPGAGVEAELDGNRYYQSGNTVTTKVDFSKFLEFADTIPNVVLNSVQLTIDVDDADNFKAPSALRLRYLNASNEFVNYYSGNDAEATLPLYPAMTYDEDGWYVIGQRINANIVGSFFDLLYKSDSKKYVADLTDFFQTMHQVKDTEFKYTNFAIVGVNPLMGKSVNRTVFNKDNIKLKIFYTIPAVNP